MADPQGDRFGSKEATSITATVNRDVLSELDFTDKQDFEDAQRGMIESFPELDIKDAKGRSIWNLKGFSFQRKEEAPLTVNPSLWRQCRVNLSNGLFKVTDRIYQIREFDIANMTVIEGDTGLILIDVLGCEECSKFGLEVYFKHRPKRDVLAVMYTHAHVDHYGGVRGVITDEDAASDRVKVIAPKGFMESAISENVYVGNAMARRSYYHVGLNVPFNERGNVDIGCGKYVAFGTRGLIPPNVAIEVTGEAMVVDGVKFQFLMAANTEAPATMIVYMPQMKALCAADNCVHFLHNLYTPRGAEVRDAIAWWKSLNDILDMWGEDVEVMVQGHNWPIWDNHRVVEMISLQRGMYKFIHDRSLNLINNGYTMLEVGEMLKLPEKIAKKFYNREYYGTVTNNGKAIYQKYIGFFSGNPADLHQFPPEDAAKKFVEYMGGSDAVLEKARRDFEEGNYRWVAQIVNYVVFADPDNWKARELQADTLEQLGYQCESGVWRNFYLTGALELRQPSCKVMAKGTATPGTIRAMTLEMLFDFMGIRLNVEKAEGLKILINFNVENTMQKYALTLENSVLIYSSRREHKNPDATLRLVTREPLNEIIAGVAKFEDQVKSGKIEVTGNADKVAILFNLLDNFERHFNIVIP